MTYVLSNKELQDAINSALNYLSNDDHYLGATKDVNEYLTELTQIQLVRADLVIQPNNSHMG